MLLLEQRTQLSPARVVRAEGNRVQLELSDGLTWAVVALAYPYEVECGDRVLAIGQDEAWYVIGVLHGSGKTSMTVPGDLCLRAPFGAIELIAGDSVKIKSPAVQIMAGKLELLARSVFERFANATRWVTETFQIRSGRLRTRVNGTYDIKAERILERAEGDVKINGRQIKLG
jgi:hypothetical protein